MGGSQQYRAGPVASVTKTYYKVSVDAEFLDPVAQGPQGQAELLCGGGLVIAVLFQGTALLGSMTVAENIALSISEYTELPKTSIDNLVRMKLCMVDLGGYENYFPSELSGGMKKRAGLARALALNPKILFLDEPSAGLDPVLSAEIDELISQINKTVGTTIIIVTHELESIFAVANRVIMLDKRSKGIIAEGNPLHLKENSQNRYVRQFFNRKSTPDVQNGI